MATQDVFGHVAERLQSPLRHRTMRERWEVIWLDRMFRIPQYRAVVMRLADGQSISSVTRWLEAQPEKGELNGMAFESIRKHVQVLAPYVQRALEELGPRPEPTPLLRQAMDEVRTAHVQQVILAPQAPMAPPPSEKVLEKVLDEVRSMDSKQILLYAAAAAKARVDMQAELEAKVKMPVPGGERAIDVLIKSGAELRKCDVADEFMKKRGVLPGTYGPYPGGLIPHEVADADEVSRLDVVDRDLLRSTMEKISAIARRSAPRTLLGPGGTQNDAAPAVGA